MTQRDDAEHPLDYPERAEIARERARRIAAIAAQCGEIIPRGALHNPDDSSTVDEEALVRDDVDAATRYFAALEEERMNAEGEAASESADAATLDFSRFRARRIRERLLGLLDVLRTAIERRDLAAVWAVLDEADACRCFPPALREEALVLAQLPPTVFRAPLKLYRYHYLLTQLGDDPLEIAMDPAQLALDTAPTPSTPAAPSPGSPRGSSTVRELPFPGPRSPDPDPRRGGSDRRRSGSR
ncbi:MAG: hypothetical protein JWL95_2808 [Gemmatimonadetes bacterium]|nr:hypothetical protein [Gemmatimonadota bacterium]